MGITYTDIEIENLFTKRRMTIRALVDSCAVFMTIPGHAALQLGYDLEEVSQRENILADGSRKTAPMVGPLRVYFVDRYCDLSALIVGDKALF
jgi:hypothetical protein